MIEKELHIIPHKHRITRELRNKRNNFKSASIWFTGLSGSGKSTLANQLETTLFEKGFQTYILDGDNIRAGLNKGLTFSENDRIENIRRISEVSKLFVDAGVLVLTAFISPFAKDRALAKELIGEESFFEVFVDCPIEICEQRDVKGLYKKARAGEILNFTGINSPFERPINPDIYVNTAEKSLEDCCNQILDIILPKIIL